MDNKFQITVKKTCDEYGGKDRRIIVVHWENEGVSVPRNNGIEIIDTE